MKQIKTAEEILKEVFSCEPNEDKVGLQFYVTLNPDVDRIIEAMQTYAQQLKPEPAEANLIMSKEDLQKALAYWWDFADKNSDVNYAAEQLWEVMNKSVKQFKPEWTAVEDGLPLEHRKIIFLTDNVLFPDNSYTGTYSQGNWHVSGNYRPVEARVTHWMYIPSLPNPKPTTK